MCRSRQELSHEYLLSLAKFGFDTAENEPFQVCPLSAYRSDPPGARSPEELGRGLEPGTAAGEVMLTRLTMLGLTQLSNYLTLKGSFSAVSKPNFASKYALESSRRDLHNALLCTVLNAQNFRQKSLKILLIFSPNSANFDKFC